MMEDDVDEIAKGDGGAAWSLQKSAVDAARSREARRRARRRWVRRIIGVFVVLAVFASIAIVAIPKPIPVEIAAVRRGPMRVTVDEAGKARVRDRYVVSAPFGGSLGRIELRAGDPVEAGRPIATLVPATPPLLDPRARAAAEARVGSAVAAHRQAEAATRRSEAALAEAQRQLDATERLAATGSVSTDALARAQLELRMRQEELSSARFATQVAASEIAAARAALGLLDPRAQRDETFEIPAPVSGRVLRVLHADAGAVAPGTPLVEIGDPEALEIAVDVLTADAARIAPGAPATLDAWGGAPLAAHVRRVEPSAFTRLSALGVEEQRVTVLLDLDAPREAWSNLADGWRVEASIVVWSKRDALVIPAGAAFRSGEGWAAFVVSGGRALRRAVTLGQRSGTEAEVVAGLGEGDVAIVHPGEQVKDGARVSAR